MGYLWASGLLLCGIWLWGRHSVQELVFPPALVRIGAIWAIAAAQLVFMVLVADDLCPRMPMVFTGWLKLLLGALWWTALCYGAWVVWARVV